MVGEVHVVSILVEVLIDTSKHSVDMVVELVVARECDVDLDYSLAMHYA